MWGGASLLSLLVQQGGKSIRWAWPVTPINWQGHRRRRVASLLKPDRQKLSFHNWRPQPRLKRTCAGQTHLQSPVLLLWRGGVPIQSLSRRHLLTGAQQEDSEPLQWGAQVRVVHDCCGKMARHHSGPYLGAESSRTQILRLKIPVRLFEMHTSEIRRRIHRLIHLHHHDLL